jgi:hypothetical protein
MEMFPSITRKSIMSNSHYVFFLQHCLDLKWNCIY